MAAGGLTLVHSQRAEDLRELLLRHCIQHPLPLLRKETILVQSNGVAEWLKIGFAEKGIAAGLEFLLPAQFLWRAYRGVLGRSAVPESSPLDKERLRWHLFRLLEHLPGAVYAPLRQFLREDLQGRRRFQLAERIADLYDQYQVYRADWLLAWEEGRDTLPGLDGREGRLLPVEQRWQAQLWRTVRADLRELEPYGSSRAEIHRQFLDALRGGAFPQVLPPRLLVFGISSLPQQTLMALAELAKHLPVLILVQDPSSYYWGDIVSGYDLLRTEARGRKQARPQGDPTALPEHGHPLLAAWGRTGRDYLAALESAATERDQAYASQRIELFTPGETRTLLQQLQDDILHLRPSSESREIWPAVDLARDYSLRFHVAHGPLRELEILQDQILEALRLDENLRPRDILIMLPTLEGYAAHIDAVFGRYPTSDPRSLSYRLVDAPVLQENPLLRALDVLLALPQSRFPASMLWDLLDIPALRRRFGIRAEDLPLLQSWLQQAGARWGLSSGQRQELGLVREESASHTWVFALQRLLLGYAVGNGAASWEIEPSYLPLDGGVRLMPFIQLLQFLAQWQKRLRGVRSAAAWRGLLGQLLEDFFLTQDDGEEAIVLMLREALQQWSEECEAATPREALSLDIVAQAWRGAIEIQTRQSAAFFSGGLTFATLMPMRAIPFRHIYLLGLNEKDYPRRQIAPEFDLLRSDYRPGDRSRREDDRYLFLEALLSARDSLQIFWSGRSPRDDSEEPPSVLVAQLRDHLSRVWGGEQDGRVLRGEAFLAALTTKYPLQAFSRQYAAAGGAHFTYAREWWSRSTDAALPLAEAAISAADPPVLSLLDLANFGKNPARYFLQQGLDIHFPKGEQVLAEDLEPFALDGLQSWRLGDERIAAAQSEISADPELALQAQAQCQLRRGEFPAGDWGQLLSEELQAGLEQPLAQMLLLRQQYPEEMTLLALDLSWKEGQLWGEIGGLRRNAAGEHALLHWSASKLGSSKDPRLEMIWPYWIEHLAVQALGYPARSYLLGRDHLHILGGLEKEAAEAYLRSLCNTAWAGRQVPIPLLLSPLAVWQEDEETENGEGLHKTYGKLQDKDLYLQRVWPDFATLLAERRGEMRALREDFVLPLQDALRRGQEEGGQP